MKTLGIETSCDETAIAIYDSDNGIIGESVHSQMQMHAEYGGVVPELASRDHCSKIINVLHDALDDIGLNSIDQIAYTSGPGLLGALLIGESFAQGLSEALNVPLIPINHLEGHLMSPMMEFPEIKMPFICLLVSGGHSMIVDVKEKGDYSILGQSQDDAVGEAFDKVSKLLKLGYPGGPLIEKLAKSGDSSAFSFPRPMTNKNNLDFSFSGLKTAVFYALKDTKVINKQIKANIAASFQDAVADTLLIKSKKALEETKQNELVIGGGVASNEYIRKKLVEGLEGNKIYFPPLERCTDNGAMVAFAGSFYLSNNNQAKNDLVRPKWPLSEL